MSEIPSLTNQLNESIASIAIMILVKTSRYQGNPRLIRGESPGQGQLLEEAMASGLDMLILPFS